MSTLDLTSGFWQIPLHPDSRKYTIFLYTGKYYQFKVIPFGLITSTASLVRGLDVVFQGTGDHVINSVEIFYCVERCTHAFQAYRRTSLSIKRMRYGHQFRKVPLLPRSGEIYWANSDTFKNPTWPRKYSGDSRSETTKAFITTREILRNTKLLCTVLGSICSSNGATTVFIQGMGAVEIGWRQTECI